MQQLIDQPTLSQKIWSGTASPTCGPVPMAADKVGTTEGCVYSFNPRCRQEAPGGPRLEGRADGESTCENPGTGEGQCGEGIEAGDKLSFKLVSQSGFVSTHQMFRGDHLPVRQARHQDRHERGPRLGRRLAGM